MPRRVPATGAGRSSSQVACKSMCVVVACDKEANASRGMCWGHYNQMRRGRLDGRPLKRSMTAEQRFNSFVEKTAGCWFWNGAKTRFGYGHFKYDQVFHLAHRWSYAHFVGDLSEDQCVLHSCDTPSCVRPDHLFLGTRLDNAKDRVVKGRSSHSGRRLSSTQAQEIRDLYAAGGLTQVEIATRFGVLPNAVSNIVNGRVHVLQQKPR